jgi:hypothetical protein
MEIFNQEQLSENTFFRTFTEDISKDQLVWHYDLKDRYMTVILASNWMFQFDDELPIKLEDNQKLFIPKLKYHRIIKGDGELKIKIEEV